jgi:hypothetical protein
MVTLGKPSTERHSRATTTRSGRSGCLVAL